MLTVGLSDVAVVALLVAEPPPCAGAQDDWDVRGEDRGGLGGQHPVEQDAAGDRTTEMALSPFVEAATKLCRDLDEQWAASRAA